ncbi:leucyl/phenylalanyl-tRNA--protein transferase [Actibacterium sp. 188UL27-1]|uniref:leucyl/phenylalanyl-tRNA--protein transferase n=1 Tax=Actibacterium sp. 188UL27-1 TaxID=2786961 RepID=UPI00195E8C8B|nr:leucyl/phenylalanyl-tRNA--protein transferase [Actibacterium sp. 188UL27-1]MBM7068309.1 leucyl/phenylalanyl-tRNA--protein transferase [Actibacterium sp. 188UL27-1]
MDAALTPELLLRAYANGIFPMADNRDNPKVFWVDPKKRGIFPLDGFHMSRSLRRRIRRAEFDVRTNTAFDAVVEACADREETWINTTIFQLYRALHQADFAHCVEVWDGDALVGGVYGVTLGSAFFGESMFSRQSDASKVALAFLIDRLRLAGFSLFDTQFLTPHLESLGAVEITRATYHRLLSKALKEPADFNAPGPLSSVQDVLQRNTHTS